MRPWLQNHPGDSFLRRPRTRKTLLRRVSLLMKKLFLCLAAVALAAGCENHSGRPGSTAASATAPEHFSPTPKPSPAGSPGTAN